MLFKKQGGGWLLAAYDVEPSEHYQYNQCVEKCNFSKEFENEKIISLIVRFSKDCDQNGDRVSKNGESC